MNIDIKHIAKVREDLDKATDYLTAELVKFEAELGNIKLGVAAFVGDKDDTKLGYGKYENKWRLLVTYKDDPTDEFKTVPAAETRRSLRLWAYKRRYTIIPALLACAEKLTAKMQKALEGSEEIEEENLNDSQ